MTDFPIPQPLPADVLPSLRRRLMQWFARHRRDLPWRNDRDPYLIWVSEVMLQQTTVAAVIPYFERFVTAFPDVKSLAAADEQEVLRLWSGLGYYRRVMNLHSAARVLVAEHGGQLPDDPKVWANLPGVGRYILGAVLSQAFDRRLPIVEANTLRLLSRLHGFRGDPRGGAGLKWVWRAAEALLPRKHVGEFNQALMEVGSLVCKPNNPDCPRCPFRTDCEANRLGIQSVIPPKPAKAPPREVREVAVAIRDEAGRVLLFRRSPDAPRWANMWELPHGERHDGEGLTAAARRVARELTGLSVKVEALTATIRHTITRWAVTMDCATARTAGGTFRPGPYAEARWVDPERPILLPLSSPQRRLLAALGPTQYE